MIHPATPNPNSRLHPSPGPSPLRNEIKAEEPSRRPSPEPGSRKPGRAGLDMDRPLSSAPASPADFVPTPGSLLARPAPVHAGHSLPSQRSNRADPPPDLPEAMEAMRSAEREAGEAKRHFAKAERELRTTQYALDNYRRNPPLLIDVNHLSRMQKVVDWKIRVLEPLQRRVDATEGNAEERRRGVRAALSAD